MDKSNQEWIEEEMASAGEKPMTTNCDHQKIANCRKQMRKSVEVWFREHEMVD